MSLIEKKYVSRGTDFRPMDLARVCQYFTLDTITDLAFGKPFGDLDTDSDMHQYIQMTEKQVPVSMLLTMFPKVTSMLQSKIFRSLFPSEKDRIGFGAIMGYVIDAY
jgi:hypothetical protein